MLGCIGGIFLGLCGVFVRLVEDWERNDLSRIWVIRDLYCWEVVGHQHYV